MEKQIQLSTRNESLLSEQTKTLHEYELESCCNKSLLLERTRETANLRLELEFISKLLTVHDNVAVESSSGGSDSAWDTKRGEQIGTVMMFNPEDFRELSRDELINRFKSEITRLKREHDSTIQEMTEDYFSIKRRCLNLEKPSLKKDKEFDVLQKKIHDIISKLDKVVLEDEKSSVFQGKQDRDFKRRLDSLLLENRRLKDSLSELSRSEANQRDLIRQLELDAEDSRIEASIYEDVFGSFLGEFVKQVQCAEEEIDLEHRAMRETSESKIDREDSCFEYYMAEEYCTAIYKEALKEADKKLGEINMIVSEKERALRSERAEKERLKEEKAKLERRLSSSEAEQKSQFVQMALSLAKWSQGFDILDSLVAEEMKKKASRLENMQRQVSDLLDEVDELKARESMYKQQMEMKTCDLHKAETEVDLLGDEIETFLDLLEKIYIGLDHYSPILKHYPGIIEILKLVRRELRGESKRPNLIV